MKLFLLCFLVCVINASEPAMLNTSWAYVAGMSNTSIPAPLLTCDNDAVYKVHAIAATPYSASATIAVCAKSDVDGNCTTAGDTSVSAIPVTSATTIYIGLFQGSSVPSELNTGTKLSGDWKLYRYCRVR